ncbi:hypothetical protein PAMP_001102 [Pampus punctatissimus]
MYQLLSFTELYSVLQLTPAQKQEVEQLRNHLEPTGLEEQIDAESFQQLGGFDKSGHVFPAVCAQGFRALHHSLVEWKHCESPCRLWFLKQIHSRLLQQLGVAAWPNFCTQLKITVHIILKNLLTGNLRRFCSGTVLHDDLTEQHTTLLHPSSEKTQT